MTDRELLTRYAADGSPEAFAELVERHAGTVYGACLRIMGESHAAEDAVQATFLLLVRKARGLSAGAVLSGWLFLTAQAVARNARKQELRRQRREREAAEMKTASGADRNAQEDLRPHLDAAVAALPAAQRDAIVMRYLRGLSEADICRELGCGQSTVATRIARGLEKLRGLLSRQGVAVPAAALGGLLAEQAGPAAVPVTLVAVLKGIGAVGASASAVSVSAVSLAEGTMKAMMIAKVKLAAAVIGGLLAVGGGGGVLAARIAASAGEPVAVNADKVLPELAPDPRVLAAINGLGDNSSVELPPVKTVGEWTAATKAFGMEKTGPVGRDYCMKAAWMPDRKRAFFCGVNHGSPHRFNDAWEYDLPSNTWVMLHPPDETWNDKIYETRDVEYQDADGKTAKTKWVFTRNGGVACGSHTWGGLTYDPNARAAIWVPAHYAGMSGRQWLEKQGLKDVYQGSVAWAYHPYRRAWQPVLGDKPWPKLNEGGFLEFVPELNMCVWNLNNWSADGTWGYDSRNNRWKKLHDVGPDVPKWALACYAQDAKTLVAQDWGKNTYHFDVQTLKWKKVLSPGEKSDDAPFGADHCAAMFYDPINKVCLAFSFQSDNDNSKKAQDFIWAYSVADRKWTKHAPNGPGYVAFRGGSRTLGYFDPERNVLVINAAEKTWLYRYKRAPEQK